MPRPCKPASPFRYFNSLPEVIRLMVLMYVRFPPSLRNVEDLLFERGIDICYETVRRQVGLPQVCSVKVRSLLVENQ
jgi:putative transposase